MLGDPQTDPENVQNPNIRQIFEQQSEFYWNSLSKCCEETKPIAAIGIVNQSSGDNYLIFGYGSIYEQAKMLATVLNALKEQINKELEA